MTDRPDDSTAPDSESDIKPDTAPATAPGTAAESAVEPAPDASGAAAEAVPPPPAKPKKVGLLAAIAGVVVALDLLTKIIVVATINPDEPVRVLGGLVYLSLIRNSGAAFSMATGYTWVLAIVAIAVVVVIIRMAPRLRSTPWAVSLGLVLGGAIGNLIDRIFRSPGVLQGHVVDFVSVFGPNAEYFPVFNVADSAITIGGISLVVTALLGIDYDGTSTRKKKAAAADDAAGDAAGDVAGEPKTGAGEDV